MLHQAAICMISLGIVNAEELVIISFLNLERLRTIVLGYLRYLKYLMYLKVTPMQLQKPSTESEVRPLTQSSRWLGV